MSAQVATPDVPFLSDTHRALMLYVIQQTDYSGAEILHLPVLSADADALVACPSGSRTAEWIEGLGIPTVPLPFRQLRHSAGALEAMRSVFRGIASARDLRARLREHPERTIVYCTSIRPGLLAAVAALGLGRRTIWVVTDFLPPPPLRWAARAVALAGCDRAVSLSQVIADDFAGRSRRLRRRTIVVNPGADLARFTTAAAGRPRAGIVGHVSPTKRTDLAVDIAERVARVVPGFELEIIGRAQYRPSDFAFERDLMARVENDDLLRQHVRFAGYAGDVPAQLARLGLLLHCRADEPFGMVLVEAMAAGLPVVAPAAAGPLEIVEHGVTGFLYPPDDAAAAADHVIELLRDPAAAARMGAAGRARAERMFTAEAQLAEMDRVLGELAGAPATSR